MLFDCCATADILTNFYSSASCFSLLWLYLGNSRVSVYRTFGPTLVFNIFAQLSRKLQGELISQGHNFHKLLFSTFQKYYIRGDGEKISVLW